MPTEEENRLEIQKYGHNDLLELWRQITDEEVQPQQKFSGKSWDPGKAFEYLILRAFEFEGAEVRWPFSVELGGENVEELDGVIYTDGLACYYREQGLVGRRQFSACCETS